MYAVERPFREVVDEVATHMRTVVSRVSFRARILPNVRPLRVDGLRCRSHSERGITVIDHARGLVERRQGLDALIRHRASAGRGDGEASVEHVRAVRLELQDVGAAVAVDVAKHRRAIDGEVAADGQRVDIQNVVELAADEVLEGADVVDRIIAAARERGRCFDTLDRHELIAGDRTEDVLLRIIYVVEQRVDVVDIEHRVRVGEAEVNRIVAGRTCFRVRVIRVCRELTAVVLQHNVLTGTRASFHGPRLQPIDVVAIISVQEVVRRSVAQNVVVAVADDRVGSMSAEGVLDTAAIGIGRRCVRRHSAQIGRAAQVADDNRVPALGDGTLQYNCSRRTSDWGLSRRRRASCQIDHDVRGEVT